VRTGGDIEDRVLVCAWQHDNCLTGSASPETVMVNARSDLIVFDESADLNALRSNSTAPNRTPRRAP
jgi:hypothetical protein